MADKVTKKFSIAYGTIYNALYECDRNGGLADYSELVGLAEALAGHNEAYGKLVRVYFEHAHDVPTSDRELAAFVLAAMGVGDIWDEIVDCEESVELAEWMNGLAEGSAA